MVRAEVPVRVTRIETAMALAGLETDEPFA